MKTLKTLTIEKGIALRINERVGMLLRQERQTKGRSIRTVARKLRIRRALLKNWEDGKSSPPGNVFYSLIGFYGKAAYQRAAELDFQLQQEKYCRELQKMRDVVDFKKLPAVIWAEEHRFSAVA